MNKGLHDGLSKAFVELSARIENGQLGEAFALFEKVVSSEIEKANNEAYVSGVDDAVKLVDDFHADGETIKQQLLPS